MSIVDSKNVFTTYDIAKILGTTDTTVKRWIKTGQLDAYKTPGGHRRITKPALERFLLENHYPAQELITTTRQIIIVDDEIDVCEMLETILSFHNPDFKISTATNGFSAGKLIIKLKPDLVILDLMMPGVDGFSVCSDIKSSPDTHHTKVLIVTGYATDDNVKRIKSCGADRILQKPVESTSLCRIVDNLLF
ncbi:response regulator [candidate division KSB1 bacterium]